MSFRLSLITFLLVAAFGEGAHPSLSTTTDGTRVPNLASSVLAYWQTVLPRSTMPSAIRDLLTPPAGHGDAISKHNMNNIQMTRKFGIHSTEDGNNKYGVKEGNKNPAALNPAKFYGKEANRGNLNPAIFYKKEAKGNNLNPAILYGKEAQRDNLNPAIIYGKKSKGNNLNPAIFYGKEANRDILNPAIIYGETANGDELNPEIINGKEGKGVDQNPTTFDGKEAKGDTLNPAIFYGNEANEDKLNPAIIYSKGANGDNLNPTIFSGKEAKGENKNPAIFYGKEEAKGDNMNLAIFYGVEVNGDKLNPAIFYGKEANNEKLNPATSYGKEANKDNLNPAIFYKQEGKGENLNPAIFYGNEAKQENLNPEIFYGNEAKGDKLNLAIFYSKEATEDNLNQATFNGKEANEDDLNPVIFYEKEANGDNLNPAIFYGEEANRDNLNPAIFYLRKEAERDNQNPAIFYQQIENQPVHVTIPKMADGNHNHFNLRKIGFLEDILKPGSKLAPYIHPASTPAPLLGRDAVDSISMARKSFTAILKMFAPVSHSMAENIWSVLDLCEHPNPAKGEKKACATSVESMVELAASVLASRDLRCFSSSTSVPAEGRNGSKAYRIAAVTAITSKGDTMTCHGAPFPYKVFLCHALVPTRVYSVVLDGGEEDTMEALVVCHLDTSEFDPEKMPQHVKPGDAAICHFLNRDDILWAPAATTLGTHGAIDVAAAL